MDITINFTETCEAWLVERQQKDMPTFRRIVARINRLSAGNFGDTKSVGDGVSELRMDFGPGYRLYFLRQGLEIVVLLCGGDKSSQASDITKAKEIAKNL